MRLLRSLILCFFSLGVLLLSLMSSGFQHLYVVTVRATKRLRMGKCCTRSCRLLDCPRIALAGALARERGRTRMAVRTEETTCCARMSGLHTSKSARCFNEVPLALLERVGHELIVCENAGNQNSRDGLVRDEISCLRRKTSSLELSQSCKRPSRERRCHQWSRWEEHRHLLFKFFRQALAREAAAMCGSSTPRQQWMS